MIPDSITNYLNKRLNFRITGSRSISGGSINRAVKISTASGEFFLKWNASAPEDFFEKEADGLKLLNSAGSGLHIPEVIAAEGPKDHRPGFLMMEMIQEGRSGDSLDFGIKLARLHQTTAKQFGLENDNYIGSLPQSNRRHEQWIDFFVEERIGPQLKMAVESGKIRSSILKNWDRLAARLDEIFPPCTPSLLHGDLWSGNYLFDSTGNGVLIDPAVYYGHPEMDLAFTKMFGGFSTDFYRGYRSESTIEAGFDERVPICNLYPLLVHVNLFGGHYTNQLEGLLKKY